MRYLSWIGLVLILGACGIGGQWMNGDPSAGKNIKPYLQRWVKEGVTVEQRRRDSVDCGSMKPGELDLDGAPYFDQKKIEAARQPNDQSTTTAEVRLRSEWQKCMIKKGYHCTESWMLLP